MSCHHWFRKWLGVRSVPNHYLNQCRTIANGNNLGQGHDENRPKSNQVIYRSGPTIVPKIKEIQKVIAPAAEHETEQKHKVTRYTGGLKLRSKKIMNWQDPSDFLIKLVFWIFNILRKCYILGLFFRKPWFTWVISVFLNRAAANILIDYAIFIEFRI